MNFGLNVFFSSFTTSSFPLWAELNVRKNVNIPPKDDNLALELLREMNNTQVESPTKLLREILSWKEGGILANHKVKP